MPYTMWKHVYTLCVISIAQYSMLQQGWVSLDVFFPGEGVLFQNPITG